MLLVCGSLQARSANRAALDVVATALRERHGVRVVDYAGMRDLPALDADLVDAPPPSVAEWQGLAAAASAVIVAAPEYAGALAGAAKNAFDWLVGSSGVYRTAIGVLSAGSTGGVWARRDLVRTLTWQGGHVVASLGVAAPRTKSDAAGRIVDAATVAALASFAAEVVAAIAAPHDARLARARPLLADAGVAPERFAPPE